MPGLRAPARRAARRVLALSGALLLAAPAAAGAQSSRPSHPAAEPSSHPSRRNAATLAFEHGVIVVDARADGRVVIGASAGDSTLIVPIPVWRARDWADSTAAILARRVPSSRRPRSYRSLMTDPDSGAGVSLTRHVLRGRSTYRLYFANTSFGGFPLDVSRHEATLLVHAVRRGIADVRTLARADSTRRGARRIDSTLTDSTPH
jgi:hypothetical protein